jgi:hypothetical protein
MPVEVIAGWLIMEAYKLIVVPVADSVRQRFVERLSKKIEEPIARRLFGEEPAEDKHKVGTAGEGDADAGHSVEADFVDTIEKAPEAHAVLEEDIGAILDLDLHSGEVRRGSDAWYVSAYAAILWRIAMLAVWEDRPIAIQGALQGREWVTVCVPKVRGGIAPSSMWQQWQQPDTRVLRRVWHDDGPVDFFVHRVVDEAERKAEITSLNKRFMREPNDGFRPAETEPAIESWHRIDGVSRIWVLIKPDALVERAIRLKRPGIPDIFSEEETLWTGSLEINPPKYEDYPPEWQELIDIESEKDAIAALSAGADEFALQSEASTVAVEAALESRPL